MKHTLIAAAACLACAGASAQVSLYGLADIHLTHISGYSQGSLTRLNSGHMDGSRWGIKVEEDMGGGWKALATMEGRVELENGGLGNRPNSGNQLPDRLTAGLPPSVANALTNTAIGPTLGVNTTNTLFDRQAWAGLVTPIGGILAGRQYTPAFEALATFDTMNTQSSLSVGQLGSVPPMVDIRYNSTVQYRIIQGPWNAALMYGFPSGAAGDNSRLIGFNTLYKTGSFSAGVAHNTKKNAAGQQSLKTTIVGASMNTGNWLVSGLYGRIEEPNSSSGPALNAGLTAAGVPAVIIGNVLDRLKQDADLLHIGLRYNLGNPGHHVTVAVNRLNDKRAANADVTSYGIAYAYPLSKRTSVHTVLTRFSNSGTGQAAPGGNGYLGGVTARAGGDATSVSIGLRHVF
jgi:predicted porin